MSDKYLDSAGLAAYNALVLEEALRSPAQTVTSSTLNLSNGRVFKWTVSANSTMTFSGTPKRQVEDIWLMLATQGDYSITWPSSVTWIDKIPIIGPYEDSIYKFTTLDGGTSWLGFCMKDSNHAWMFTVDTEATAAGEKKTGIPLNLYGQTGVTVTVDWGDGTTSTLTSADYTASNSTASVHEYAAAGRYTVLMKSNQWDDAYFLTINDYFNDYSEIDTVNDGVAPLYWWRRTLVKVDLPIPKVSGIKYYDSPTSVSSLKTISNDFAYLFFCRCNKLKNICKGLFDNNTSVTNFYGCFYNCTSLTAIPSGLFDNNTAVTSFYACFDNCTSLAAIPSGLFDNNTAVTSFNVCFYKCTSLAAIPSGLFNNNTAVTDFSSCFRNCTSLAAIPSGLFDNNTAVTSFGSCFYNCTSLTTIPAGLFDKNTAVDTFSYCFRNCSSLANFTLHIGSPSVSSCSYFVTDKSGTTRTVYVPSGSTTETTFNAVASSLGLTIVGE